MLVLVFHLSPSRLPGGFVGVDVFFVISGFLITTLLLREHRRTGRVDLADFWRRRARRLLPALFTVVLAGIAAARLTSSDLLVGVRRQTFGAFTFSTNWVEINAGTDYFDDTSRSLLNPLWSLAVEEQFYLLWPVVFSLLGVSNLAPQQVARLLRFVGLGSAALMAARFSADSVTRVYYGTDTHLFGLMIGASIAYAFFDSSSRFARLGWRRVRQWVGFVATAALIILSLTLHSDSAAPYRGGILGASLCSALMVAALPGQPSGYTRLLEMAPLRWIGERSYGIYLWHWPAMLVISELSPPAEPGSGLAPPTVITIVAATLVLSDLSFRYIETPIRSASAPENLRALGRQPRQQTLRERRRSTVRWAIGGMVATVAMVGIATAPDRSAAQWTVEAGQRLIDDQAAAALEIPVIGDGRETSASARAEALGTSADAGRAGPGISPAEPTPVASVALSDPEPRSSLETSGQLGDSIIGLGDSVLSGAAPAMYRTFPGIRLEARPILKWVDAPDIVNRVEAEGALRRIVILNFGTNAGLVSKESQQALREVLGALGPQRRVILVTVVGISKWVPDTNAALARISADYPNSTIADWRAVVARKPELLHSDRTHPNRTGIEEYADLMLRTASRFGSG